MRSILIKPKCEIYHVIIKRSTANNHSITHIWQACGCAHTHMCRMRTHEHAHTRSQTYVHKCTPEINLRTVKLKTFEGYNLKYYRNFKNVNPIVTSDL